MHIFLFIQNLLKINKCAFGKMDYLNYEKSIQEYDQLMKMLTSEDRRNSF